MILRHDAQKARTLCYHLSDTPDLIKFITVNRECGRSYVNYTNSVVFGFLFILSVCRGQSTLAPK